MWFVLNKKQKFKHTKKKITKIKMRRLKILNGQTAGVVAQDAETSTDIGCEIKYLHIKNTNIIL